MGVHTPIAEMVKHSPFKGGITGSSPVGSTNILVYSSIGGAPDWYLGGYRFEPYYTNKINCEYGVNGNIGDFQSFANGSSPFIRSKINQ